MTTPLVYAARFMLVISWVSIATAQAPVANSNPRPVASSSLAPLAPSVVLADRLFTQADRNADQKLTQAEFVAVADVWFDALDPDRAGTLRQDEFVQKFESLVLTAKAGETVSRGIAAASSALGVFVIADQDHDGLLRRIELKRTLESWFLPWDADHNETLGREEIAAGFNAVLPRTNLSGVAGRDSQEPIAGLPTPPPSPVLSPQDSMKTIELVDGFTLQLAASEPMIEDPVALSFDEDGRAYVVEMRGYMLDIDRSREREPISRISRLEDTDGNGSFDRSTIFVDHLVLPRAVAAFAGGILYVSDYKLYFAQDTDDDGRADRIELVDADYGKGNVEHAPNGLFRAMDNWIYNGESPYRYRLVNGTLIKQVTEVRGQWGMTQDNYGHLFYNVNNSQLLGDFAPPNYMGRNAHHPGSAGLNLFVATDQRVFPIRMTTAVNRGYSPGVLDPSGKAYVFASSCSPVIYRGDNYPGEFAGNAFVCDPALNLIKRNLVTEQPLTLTSRFAYDDHEFLASTDERFRPANLYNGPDGTLWFVDLYRGIAQYGQFMTSYLRRETLARGLDQGIHQGRIYRIVSNDKKPAAVPHLSREDSATLVARLASANGWIRDTAQRLLVERGDREVAPALARVIADRAIDPVTRIHALWTLEGLFASVENQPASSSDAAQTPAPRLMNADANFKLRASALPPEIFRVCLNAIDDPNAKVQVAAIRVAELFSVGDVAAQTSLLENLDRLVPAMSEETLFQAVLTAGNLRKPDVLPLFAHVVYRAADQRLIREAVLSGLQDWELPFLQLLLTDPLWSEQRTGRSSLLQMLAAAVIKERLPTKVEALLTIVAEQAADQVWRQHALLEGVAGSVQSVSAAPILLEHAPAAMERLARSDDAKTRQQSGRIASHLDWPGHVASKTAAIAAPSRALNADEQSLVIEGKTIFEQLCAGCHGLSGQGTAPMAPPLVNSEWVLGPEDRLVRIILHGVTGLIAVNGTTYQPPAILPEMPGLGTLENRQIAAVLSYLRRTWGHAAAPISTANVLAIRKTTIERKTPWTAEQLSEIK